VRVERLLQISVAMLAAMGSLLLAIGQWGGSMLPFLATFAAFSSVYVTDMRRWILLNRSLANFAALFAVLFSFIDFWDPDSSNANRLHAIAKLLIYLQIVLLFQPKTTRVYWHLAMLSLLQVVVAAPLNMGVTFGFMLIPYVFVSLTTLSLFFVYREALHVDTELKAAHDAVENRPLFGFLSRKPKETDQAATAPRPAIALTGGLPANLASVFTGGRMMMQVAKMGLFTLVMTVVLFYCFPRFDRGQLPGGLGRLGTQTGFKNQVSLNHMGSILQSDQFVMRVQITDAVTGSQIDTEYEPFFRGTSLSTYYPQSRSWIVGSYSNSHVTEIGSPPDVSNLVRQTVATNPNLEFDRSGEGIMLFSMYPAYATENTNNEIVNNHTLGILSVMVDGNEKKRQPDVYEMYSAWTPFSVRGHLIPNLHPVDDIRFQDYIREECTEIPLDSEIANTLFPGTVSLADEIVAKAKGSGLDSKLEFAKRLERHFLEKGAYGYSLSVSPHLKNPRLDPIEDFVINHKLGHCEFFASALAIMLRSQGIPARLVVGYKGGEFNTFGGFYAVKQKDAHAWVECYFSREELPSELADSPEYAGGAWYRLDPTPSSRRVAKRDDGTLTGALLDWFDYVELAWRDYVIYMDSERQEKDIYKPLSDSFMRPMEDWVSKRRWVEFIQSKLASVGIHLSDEWFNGFASIFTMLVLLVFFVILELGRSLLRRIWPRLIAFIRRVFPSSDRNTGFYHRAERMLRRAGWKRRVSDTPREFIERVIQDCHNQNIGAAMVKPLQQLVDTYYRARFGNYSLQPEERIELDQHLGLIEVQTAEIRRVKR